MPETYNIREVSTWSADADGTGTNYLKIVDADVSYLPGQWQQFSKVKCTANVDHPWHRFASILMHTTLYVTHANAQMQRCSRLLVWYAA